MMAIEQVYNGHDGTIDLILKEDGVAVSLASVTKITLSVGATLVSSTNQASDPIRWNQGGYDTGEIRMTLGDQGLSQGDAIGWLTVYTAGWTDGIVWGTVDLRILDEVEASA
jgi:hypothetical protein